jgi:hypothetical protein
MSYFLNLVVFGAAIYDRYETFKFTTLKIINSITGIFAHKYYNLQEK